MKIIVGTPRSGTTFTTNWYANEYPDHEYLIPEKLGEYFHPDHFETKNVDQETLDRIQSLPKKCVFKVHTGLEMSDHIWSFLQDKPIILVKRKDLIGQFVSYGIGYATNKWVTYSHIGNNGLFPNQKLTYERWWFDELKQRLEELDSRTFNVERIIWYEDIPNMPINGKLPLKQNSLESLNTFVNKDELVEWINDFTGQSSLVYR